MKRILSTFLAAAMLASVVPASLAEGGAEYIPAPYNAEEVDPTKTYLEPVYYENENGPTIGVTTVGVIKQDGLYFKDLNNNHELDVFEDWRQDAETRAADMVTNLRSRACSRIFHNFGCDTSNFTSCCNVEFCCC